MSIELSHASEVFAHLQLKDGLEAAMLISFSISWYWSIAKMLRTGQAAGKSAAFVALICFGYIVGILSKIVGLESDESPSPLLWLYVWNLTVTLADLWLVLRLSRPSTSHRPRLA